MKSYRQLKEKLNLQAHQLEATSLSSKKLQVTVLILGESTNRNHMSLYNENYHETSPLLSKNKDLTVYTDVVIGYCHTLESVPNSLSESNLENGLEPSGKLQHWSKFFSLLDIKPTGCPINLHLK